LIDNNPGDPDARAIVRALLLFGFVVALQIGHLIEHIAVALSGHGLIGLAADSELSHLLFNGLIAILSILLIRVYPTNPWVYPLALLSVFHAFEHIYIFAQYVRTGTVNGPGLLGIGGAIGIVPLARLDLHNVYNGLEVILMVLGIGWELDACMTDEEVAFDENALSNA